jgi:hypothetical protein
MAGAKADLNMYDCGCGETGGEVVSPPEVLYRKEDSQYELIIKLNVRCGCGKSGVFEVLESGWGIVTNMQWLGKKHKHNVIPVKQWPRVMEEHAVQLALDMEDVK